MPVRTQWVMMALGAYRFALATAAYQRFSRSAEQRWSAQPRAGRRPALQYLGAGEERISLSGVIHPHFKGGLRQVAFMRAEAATGLPLMMVDGLGRIWGRWAIQSVTEEQGVFFADGAPREIHFSLDLSYYGEDLA